MVEPELDLAQMDSVPVPDCCSWAAADPQGRCPSRSSSFGDWIALPDVAGRSQSLVKIQLVVKDVKQAALFISAQNGQYTFTFPRSTAARAIMCIIIIFLPLVRRHDFIVVIFNLPVPEL